MLRDIWENEAFLECVCRVVAGRCSTGTARPGPLGNETDVHTHGSPSILTEPGRPAVWWSGVQRIPKALAS